MCALVTGVQTCALPIYPLFRQCWTGAQPVRRTKGGDGGTRVSWSDGCGLTIRAKAFLSGQNPGLVVDLNVAMVQQGDLYDHAEATQAELQRLGKVRREAERSEEHTSELQSLMSISYAVFSLKKKI